MPELPEVETTVRALRPLLVGEQIAMVDVRRPDMRRPFPPDLMQRLVGARVIAVERRAKYGRILTDRDDALIFHLGMSGRWRTDADVAEKHDHLVITTGGGRRIALNDPRRFGFVDLVAGDAPYPPFTALGPEPLSEDFDAAALTAAVAGRAPSIKALLLDQRVVAGLGNIYVSEALFMAGIDPASRGGAIDPARLGPLVVAIKAVLERAIAAGGSSLRDFVHPDGQLGYFSHQWQVYGRAGDPCRRCAAPVSRIVQAGRSTFFCAACQR